MTKQTINIGTSANKGDGDPLRTAFTKINSNFTELYDAIGLGDGLVNLGSLEFSGSTITTTDSSRIEIAQEVRITSDLTMRGSIVPNIDNHFDLGSQANQWRSLYVSSNTIFIGGVPIAVNNQGNLTVNGNLVQGGEVDLSDYQAGNDDIRLQSNGEIVILSDNREWKFDNNGLLTFPDATVQTTAWTGVVDYNTLTNKPNLAGTYQFSVAADDSTQRLISTNEVVKFTGAGGVTTSSDAEGNITITGSVTNLTGYATETFVTTRGYLTSVGTISYNDLSNKPVIPQAYTFSVAADDSTQRVISNNESIKFIGAGGVTTSSDAEGNITITGSGSSGAATGIESETDVSIRVNLTDSTQRIWRFGEDGDTVFPNNVSIRSNGGQYRNIVAEDNIALTLLGSGNSGTVAMSWNTAPQQASIQFNNFGAGNKAKATITAANAVNKTWVFDEDGLLTLPAGGVISEGGGISGAIKLKPAGGANANQALLIYPTAGVQEGDHVHLTAGGGSTELYLGNDSRYVKLANGGDIAILANNGAANRVYNWVGQGGWNSPPYTNRATTGGTGTGLTVNISTANGGYIDINSITIHTAGTGYTDGDVITITNENNFTGTFQIGVAANNWTFGTDGTLASEEFKIKTLNGIPTSITGQTNDTQFWDYNYGSNLATTGGTGSGLFVNVGDGGNGYASIVINEPGTGYSPGDVITVTNGPLNGAPYASSVTFTIGVSGTRSWQFDRYGALTLPSGNGSSVIQSVQQNSYQSKVTVSPFQILSQARKSQTANYTVANEDFTSAASDGNGMIAFVGLQGGVAEFITDTMENGGVYERTVRLNGAGPEYGYSSFNDTDDELFLVTAAPAGAVTSIRFSYTRISKIDICPDEGVFRIESEPSQDIDIQSGEELRLTANDRVDIDTGSNMRLRAGDGSVQIITNYLVPGADTRTWQFGTGGELTLPNGAVLRNTAGDAIAFGQGAGLNSQGAAAIAIGADAGYYPQGADAVAIGRSAGENYQGANAIAIGNFAGYNNQAANSIVLNATGVALEQTTANTFTVKPVRQDKTANAMYYNSSTGEITYDNAFSFSVAADDSTQRLISNNESIKFIGAGGVTTSSDAEGNITINYVQGNIRSEGNIDIEINLTDSTLRRWRFGEDGDLTFPDNTVQTTAFTISPTLNVLKIEDGVHEKFQALADATGTVTHNCASGHVFYHTSPDANWTANFTNLNLSTGYVTAVSLIIVQGATGYYPDVVQIGGVGQTINWQGNATPTVSTNRTDVVTFSIINNSGTYTVLGQITGF
jgi:hypothetical protein